MRRQRLVLFAAGVSTVWLSTGLVRAQQEAPSAAVEQSVRSVDEPPIHPNEPVDQPAIALSDVELASWLLIQNKVHAHLGGHAANRAAREEVRQFAAQIGDSHQQLIAALHAPLEQQGEKFDVAGTLREVGQRLGEVNQVRRRIAGFRGTTPPAAGSPAADPAEVRDLGRQIRDQRAEVREQRGEVRDESGRLGILNRDQRREAADGEDARTAQRQLDEENERLTELRRERREAVGRVLRDAMPTIRENLPATIEAIAVLIEKAEGQSGNQALIQFENRVADLWAERTRQELDRHDAESYDRAYLEFTVLSHAKLVDALTLAQSVASPQMRPVVDQVLASTQEHLQQARDLLQKLDGSENS